MSSYQSRRNNGYKPEEDYNQSATSIMQDKKQQEKDSTKKLTKDVAKGAAIYAAGPEGGAAVDMAANTKAGDKILNKGADALGKNPAIRKAAKKLDDAGVLDAADKAMSMAGGAMGGGAGAGANAGAGASAGANAGAAGTGTGAGMNNAGGGSTPGGSSSSLSGGDKGTDPMGGFSENNPFSKKNKNKDNNNDKDQDVSQQIFGSAAFKTVVKIGLAAATPFILLLFLIILIVSAISGASSNFDDALGISNETGFSTGNLEYSSATPEQKEFYKRVVEVRDEYSQNNISVDALQIVAVYHVLNAHRGSYNYDYMTKGRIKEIVEQMLYHDKESDTKYYSEETFKYNLENKYFPDHFHFKSSETYKQYTEEVFTYIEQYYQLIGYQRYGSCTSSNSCNYNIKGFYIYGKGNINKNLNVTNLKVRLMQSGTANGHNYGGTFGKPLEGEELVDFEKYILGVAYAEIGNGSPDEAIKAQMVAARSYILARSTDMGGWRTLTQENGMWVIQVAASTQDQVYCDPDRGCSSDNCQWGQVHSGLEHNGGYKKNPLPTDDRMRTLANEVAGEVLVNSQGYIIYSGYMQAEQNQFISLAKQGLNYKQILYQVYNSGSRNYGASDVQKMTCANSAVNCSQGVTGDIVGWKQYQGPWIGVPMGNSGKTLKQIGCLVTSISIQIARSGVPTNIQGEFNPGSFVEYLNTHGGFAGGGNLLWAGVSKAAPTFVYQGKKHVLGYSRGAKYQTLTELLNQGYYVVAEVKGNTGQHWVAVLATEGGEVTMADPGSAGTSMWHQYNWGNTSTFAYFKAG